MWFPIKPQPTPPPLHKSWQILTTGKLSLWTPGPPEVDSLWKYQLNSVFSTRIRWRSVRWGFSHLRCVYCRRLINPPSPNLSGLNTWLPISSHRATLASHHSENVTSRHPQCWLLWTFLLLFLPGWEDSRTGMLKNHTQPFMYIFGATSALPQALTTVRKHWCWGIELLSSRRWENQDIGFCKVRVKFPRPSGEKATLRAVPSVTLNCFKLWVNHALWTSPGKSQQRRQILKREREI